MCATCGCGDDGAVRVIDVRPEVPRQVEPHHHQGPPDHDHGPEHNHVHDEDRGHDHDDGHGHGHDDGHGHTHSDTHPVSSGGTGGSAGATETLVLQERVLARNDELAARNRSWLRHRGVIAVNLMSSPGSGKTTLLERTIRELPGAPSLCVIEGDQETTFDADRIRAAGAAAVQINTGAGCHLDASMVRTALDTLDPAGGFLMIENVGNLVCPALFDLGEDSRVVIMSVTEGADKPRKYPHIFSSATLVLVNKIDLLPWVDFDLARFTRDVQLVNGGASVLTVSATRGDGLEGWYDWLLARAATPVLPLVGSRR